MGDIFVFLVLNIIVVVVYIGYRFMLKMRKSTIISDVSNELVSSFATEASDDLVSTFTPDPSPELGRGEKRSE
jgi:hypothetical protein